MTLGRLCRHTDPNKSVFENRLFQNRGLQGTSATLCKDQRTASEKGREAKEASFSHTSVLPATLALITG